MLFHQDSAKRNELPKSWKREKFDNNFDRQWKIEALMDLKHAPRKQVLDNLSKTAPLTLPWDQMDKQYTREFVYSLA